MGIVNPSSRAVRLTADRGYTFRQLLRLKTPDGEPMDLSGYTARLQVRPRPEGDLIVELSTSDGTISIDSEAGEITLLLTPAQTLLEPQAYRYDLRLSFDGEDSVLIAGEFVVQARITEAFP